MQPEESQHALAHQVFHSFKGGSSKKKLSADALQDTMLLIDILLADVYLPRSDLKYTDVLYPHQIAMILLLAQMRPHVNEHVDEIIEHIFAKWLKENVMSPTDYTNKLMAAIKDLNCTDGMTTRLNIEVLAQPAIERTVISTKFGSITQEKVERKPQLNTDIKERLRIVLGNKYVGNMNSVYNLAAALKSSYSLEQILISWLGYMVVRTIASNATTPQVKYLFHKSDK